MCNPLRSPRGIIALLVLCALAVPVSAEAAWLSPEWNRRIPFSVSDGSIGGAEAFADFTLLLELDAPEFGAVFVYADSAGQDLAITSEDGTTMLDHELVSFDSTSQTAEIWFRASELSDASRSFYLYYDLQPEAGIVSFDVAASPGSAWSSDHLAVYHFAEDPSLGVLKDWSESSADAVAAVRPNGPIGPGWTSSDLVAGAVGTGWVYDGVDEYTYVPSVTASDSSLTISAWFANSQAVDKGATAFQSASGWWRVTFQQRGGAANPDLATPQGTMVWPPVVTDEDLHHYAWVLDAEADTAQFYFDGVEREVWTSYTPPGSSDPIWTGVVMDDRIGVCGPVYFNNLDLADGVADEFRLVEGVRSSGWILTEYNNQSDSAAFYDVGAEEVYSGGPTGVEGPLAGLSGLGRVLVTPNPFRGVASVSIETAQSDLTVRVYDLRGQLVRTLGRPTRTGDNVLRFLWDGRDAGGSKVSNGAYFIQARSGTAVVTGKATLIR